MNKFGYLSGDTLTPEPVSIQSSNELKVTIPQPVLVPVSVRAPGDGFRDVYLAFRGMRMRQFGLMMTVCSWIWAMIGITNHHTWFAVIALLFSLIGIMIYLLNRNE